MKQYLKISVNGVVENYEFSHDFGNFQVIHLTGGLRVDVTGPVAGTDPVDIEHLIEEFVIWLERDGDIATIETTDGGDDPSPVDESIAAAVQAVLAWHESRYDGIEEGDEWQGYDTGDEGNPFEIVTHTLYEMTRILEGLGYGEEISVWDASDGLHCDSSAVPKTVLNRQFLAEYSRRLKSEAGYRSLWQTDAPWPNWRNGLVSPR